MKLKRLVKLVELADKHQARLQKIHTLLDDSSIAVNPNTQGSILAQIVDLSNTTTYLLGTEMSPQSLPYRDEMETLNYTFSPQDLDAELESFYEDEVEEDDDEDDVDERR